MNNPFKTVKNHICRYKKEEWFKPVLAIIIMTILAFGAVGWRRWQDKKDDPPERSETEQAEESLVEKYATTASCILQCLYRFPLPCLRWSIVRIG